LRLWIALTVGVKATSLEYEVAASVFTAAQPLRIVLDQELTSKFLPTRDIAAGAVSMRPFSARE
jgi:hypothetical protein